MEQTVGKERMERFTGEIRERVLQSMDFSKDCPDEEVKELIFQTIQRFSSEEFLLLSERKILERAVFNSLRKLDFIQDLLEDEQVTEIMINGPDRIYIEKEGKILLSDKTFASTEKLEDMIQQIVAGCNRTVNESSPMTDARLSDGSRVNIVEYFCKRRNKLRQDDPFECLIRIHSGFLQGCLHRGFGRASDHAYPESGKA